MQNGIIRCRLSGPLNVALSWHERATRGLVDTWLLPPVAYLSGPVPAMEMLI